MSCQLLYPTVLLPVIGNILSYRMNIDWFTSNTVTCSVRNVHSSKEYITGQHWSHDYAGVT